MLRQADQHFQVTLPHLSQWWDCEIAVLNRTALIRQGRRLECFTVVWNALKGLVVVDSGLVAGSISHVGFGVDSYKSEGQS
jgi:hypothetical protein